MKKSDHNLVFLQSQYKPHVLRQLTTTQSFRKWSPEADEALRNCIESADWNVLQEPHGEDMVVRTVDRDMVRTNQCNQQKFLRPVLSNWESWAGVPALKRIPCIILVFQKPHSSKQSDFRPVAMISHIMKTLEWLLLDPLQLAYEKEEGVEDAILHLLHRAYFHLDKGCGAVRIMVFDFFSAFKTIQPPLLRNKLAAVKADPKLSCHRLPYGEITVCQAASLRPWSAA